MKTILATSLILFSIVSLASEVNLKVIEQVKGDRFSLGVGSKVLLELPKEGRKMEAVFVGRMVGHHEFGDEILLMNSRSGRISMVDSENLRSTVAKSKMQSLISTIDQSGETCAAYGIYHLWKQIHLTGYKGTADFELTFSQEKLRMKLLEESITGYYMARTYNVNNVLKKMGERFGFKCRERIFKETGKAIGFIYAEAVKGNPVVMEFNIGKEMMDTENDLIDFETNKKIDSYLWGPRKIGQRNVGGHVVLAAGAFTHKNLKKIVVLDSNWNEPRIWDMEKFLGGKTAIKEMIFHVCDSKDP